VIERPRRRARFSRVNSSHIESALMGRPSEVASKMKSSAHTWLGRSADRRQAGTVLVPSRRRLRTLAGTRSPSSRQSRCTRLRLTSHPSLRNSAQARRKPYRGHVCANLSQARSQRLLGRENPPGVTLRGALLSGHPASPPLRDAEHLAEVHDGVSPARRAQKFPRATSLSIQLSRVRSATTRLSRPFSSLSRRSSLASSAFMPPYWLRQRLYVCSLISSSRATSATFLPSAASRSPSRSLRITCSAVCFRPFIEFLLPLLEALRNSHISWTSS